MAARYMHFVGDYACDTKRLRDAMEHGAYRLIIDFYISTGGPIEVTEAELRRIAMVDARVWNSRVRAVVLAFFQVEVIEADPTQKRPKLLRLSHKRCDDELSEQKRLSDGRSKGAKTANERRWGHRSANGSATHLGITQRDSLAVVWSPSDSPSDAPSPPRTRTEPLTGLCSSSLSPAVAAARGTSAAPADDEPGWEAGFGVWKAWRGIVSPVTWKSLFKDLRVDHEPDADDPTWRLSHSSPYCADQIRNQFADRLERALGHPLIVTCAAKQRSKPL